MTDQLKLMTSTVLYVVRKDKEHTLFILPVRATVLYRTDTHRSTVPNFKNKEGKVAKNDNENAKILKDHYQEVFNRSVPVDLSVLQGIIQLPSAEEYGAAPSKKEIKIAINNMKNNKAPAVSQVSQQI